jgi:SAM-dependent methyltransferase
MEVNRSEMAAVANWLVSRLLDLAMRNRALDPYRRATVGAARGIVLEIGVGLGLNLGLYAGDVDHVFALDPSIELLRMAQRRSAQAAVPASFEMAAFHTAPIDGLAIAAVPH